MEAVLAKLLNYSHSLKNYEYIRERKSTPYENSVRS
jgi:hypothetical protein